MNKKLALCGIFPPVPTNFDGSGNVDINSIRQNIKYLNKFDLAGYVVLGTNGEFVLLNEKEKLQITETVKNEMPDGKILIAGTGCESTRETIELTKKVAGHGVDAVLIITPSYYKPRMTPDVLIKHFISVADNSPVPLIIYNMPACTGIDIAAETVLIMSEHPNIVAVKDSGGNIAKLGEIKGKVKPGFKTIAGSAGFLLPALTVGADAGILALANIAPQECIDIYQNYISGNIEKAGEIQLRIIPVNSAVTSKWGVPALKAAMDILGLNGGPLRSPLQPVSDEIKNQLKNILNKGGIKKQ